MDEYRLNLHLNNGEAEYIMCAANYYDDKKEYPFQPFNIDTGFVICGWRHACCGMSYLASNKNAKRWDDCIQGFLTNKNRFLNREESLELVKNNTISIIKTAVIIEQNNHVVICLLYFSPSSSSELNM
mgnify:CR=1 FL=1